MASDPVFALAAALTARALAGKLGCGLGVVDKGVSRLAVGIGMLPRGEAGLIFAGIGTTFVIGGHPVFDQSLFSALVLMVQDPAPAASPARSPRMRTRSRGPSPRECGRYAPRG